jgi:hypothetical protein
MWGVVVLAVIVAAVATLIAVAIAYWWVWLVLGAVGFAVYYFHTRNREKANQV